MNNLLQFKEFVHEINSENGRLYKQSVLNKYRDDEIVKLFLKFAFDPFIQFGLGIKKLNKQLVALPEAQKVSALGLLTYLQFHNTGTDYQAAMARTVIQKVSEEDNESAEILRAIICKDLSIGCDAKTINKMMPGLIPTFAVQLAEKYFDKPEKVEGKEFAITTKIDGGRIIAIKENGRVSFYTRAGQRYEGLVDLEREMSERLPDNYVLDGEITLLDYQSYNSKTAYKLAMKITRTDGEKHGVKMLVFDGMPVENWKAQYCPYSWSARRSTLDTMFSSGDFKYFELLPVLYQGTDTSKILELLDSEIARGQEGIMINICDATYDFKRTWNLMKVKKMNDIDLTVIDFEEGSGRLVGTLGALHVRYKNNSVVRVGSGFSDEQRKEIWENQQKYLGAICTVQYFETTVATTGINAGQESLRFPVFCDFRFDKTMADF